jgi:hypothetical protein
VSRARLQAAASQLKLVAAVGTPPWLVTKVQACLLAADQQLENEHPSPSKLVVLSVEAEALLSVCLTYQAGRKK